MKNKNIKQLIVIILLVAIIFQPMQMTVNAATGAVVTGASGTQYTLNHQYVKQLNINTGNITISDTGYTQTNGATESWDASSDAYVIKGQGSSTNTITITNVNYVPTIYLLETEWSGYINIQSSIGCKLVIVGNVKAKNASSCGLVYVSNTSMSNTTKLEVVGLDKATSFLTADYIMGYSSNPLKYIGSVSLNNLNINCMSLESGVQTLGTFDMNNIKLTESKTLVSNESIRLFSNNNLTINNVIANHLVVIRANSSSTTTINTFISNSEIDSCYIQNSQTSSITLENSYFNYFGGINQNKATFKNVVIINFGSNFSASLFNLIDSTLANTTIATANFLIGTYKINHSSFNDAGEGWVLDSTPTDDNANDVFLKKVRFRDNPNTYFLVTFPDGHISKLLSDTNGYIYPFVPKNSTNLLFQATDETGTANFGGYKLDYAAITTNDTTSNEPSILIQPTTITFSPYANTQISYSFDKSTWTPVTTDSNCQFKVVFPDGIGTIYLKYNGKLYSVTKDESGNAGSLIELKPKIVSQSAGNVSLIKGSQGTIFVNAKPVNANDTLQMQWYKDGIPLTGETNNVLTFSNPNDADIGTYTCNVSEDGLGTTTSSPIAVSVVDSTNVMSLNILAQSGNKTVTEDSTTEFYVVPNITEGVSYQWQKDGVNINGATSSKYNISTVKQSDEATYTCILKKDSEAITSNPITLTVVPNPLAGNVSELQDTVNNLTTQVNTLQTQINTANESLSDLQDMIDTLTGQINNLNNQITALNGQINDLSGNVSDLQDQVNALIIQKGKLQGDLDNANTEKAALQITINDLNIEIINKDNQVTYLQSLLDASEHDNEELQNQIDTLNVQISDMTVQINNLVSQVTTLTSERDSLQTQLDTANNTITNLQQKIIDLTNENHDLSSQLDSALLQIIILQGQVNALTTQNTNLEGQVNTLQAQIVDLQHQLDNTGSDNVELLQQISTLNTQVNNLTTQINQKDSQIASLNGQISNLNTTITNLQTAVNNALDSLSEYEGTVLQDKINKILQENSELKNALTTLVQDKNSLLTQITDLNNLIISLQGENSSLSQQLQAAENQITNLQSSLTLEIAKSNALQTQVDTLNGQITDLQTQLGQADSDKDSLINQITVLQGNLTSLNNQLTTSNTTIADLNTQISSMNSTIVNLQNQINNALSELSEYEGNNLLEKIQDIKNKQTDITADLNEANALNSSLNSQLDTVNTQLTSLQHQIDVLTGQLGDKDAQITELLALIAQKDTEITGKNTQINNLQNQVQSLQDTIDSLTGGNDIVAELTQQVNSLTQQINILNTKVNDLTGQLNVKDALINDLTIQLAAKNAQIIDLLKQIQDLQNSSGNQDEVNKLKDDINKLNDELTNAYDNIEKLKQQLEDLKNNPVTVVVPGSSGEGGTDTIADPSVPSTIIKEVNPDNVNEVVTNPVITNGVNTDVVAQNGWELSSSLSKNAIWSDSLSPVTESYTGLYTFFDNGLNSDTGVLGAAMTVGYNGVPVAGLIDTKDGYMKYTFYARKVADKNNIYVCSVDIEKENYTTPVTSITSSLLKEPRSFTPENSYNTLADKAITLKLSADYGKYGRAAIKYQIVPESMDFDPDGTWKNVEGNTVTIPKQQDNFRVYVKFIDKNGNYTVDKTVGFKVSTEKSNVTSPVFTMYKTVYLGYDYQVQLANVDGKVSYSSSNKKVASVNKSGVITSVNYGNAVISCTVKGKMNYTYKVIVTVADGKGKPTLNFIAPELQTSSDSTVLMMYKQLKKDSSTKVDISGLSKNARITYVNTDSNIAYISKYGTITGLKKGNTDILAIVDQEGRSYIYYIKVRVDDGTADPEYWTYLTAA